MLLAPDLLVCTALVEGLNTEVCVLLTPTESLPNYPRQFLESFLIVNMQICA